MAFWPFGRRRKLEGLVADAVREKGKLPATQSMNPRQLSEGNATGTAGRKSSRRGRRQRKKALNRNDSENVSAQHLSVHNNSAHNISAATQTSSVVHQLFDHSNPHDVSIPQRRKTEADLGLRIESQQRSGTSPYQSRVNSPQSQSMTQLDEWQRVPTLRRKKRAANDAGILRRKSSKRRKDEQQREQEIRALSAPVPIPSRPVTHSGAPLQKGIHRIRGDGPSSNVSLPLPQSTHSSLSSASDHGFKVRSFDMFSPRPKIQYSENSRNPSGHGSWGPSRSASRRGVIDWQSEPAPIPEEIASKTVDDFANSLDASGLRKLMERDQRRRDEKRASDEARFQRRLRRQAERQAENERRKQLALEKFNAESINPPITDALVQYQPTNALAPSRASIPSQKLTLGRKGPTRYSQASLSPPSSPTAETRAPPSKARATYIPLDSSASERPATDIPASEASTRASRTLSWTALFRRSRVRSSRGSIERGEPKTSEFTTSRDSLTRHTPTSPIQWTSQRKPGTPTRTMSKFREDLPELPISPPISLPNSRVQSPDAMAPLVKAHRAASPELTTSQTSKEMPAAASEGELLVKQQSLRSRTATPTSGKRSVDVPSPDPSAIVPTLASIDSEGSWLSGRPAKAASLALTQTARTRTPSLQRRHEDFSDSNEDLGVTEDEYFAHISKGSERRRESAGLSAGLPLAESDDEHAVEGEAGFRKEKGTWHSGFGRQPTVVHHAARAKSTEGLLNEFLGGGDAEKAESPEPESPDIDSPIFGIQRAKSVDLGSKHARHISAGSARLLDIAPRASTDFKRLSSGSHTSDRQRLSSTSEA
ncbi:MAG: hypothetical protein M1829_004876 [Trizodia sp. TS-e1964]|nr:MAG: hypothetical protein M1829_004876 [Trizodia sp. TS-e1964]